jgi:hypothetical protein
MKMWFEFVIYVMAAICMQFQAILPAQKYSNFYINRMQIAGKIRAICAGNAWINCPFKKGQRKSALIAISPLLRPS